MPDPCINICQRRVNSFHASRDTLTSILGLASFGLLKGIFFISYIYPPDSQESDRGAIHRASNYPDLLTEVGAHHPNIWRFIKCFQKEQSFNEVQIEQYVAGIEPVQPRKRYLNAAKRIKRLVHAFDPDDIVEYIRGITHNLSFS